MFAPRLGNLGVQRRLVATRALATSQSRLPLDHRYAIFGRADVHTDSVCPAGDSYGNFRQVAMIVEADPPSPAVPVPFASRQFNVTPTTVFQCAPPVDPGCVDFYNPSPIDVSGVTFIFPAATRHLDQPNKPGTSFPSPYTSCRTMNDGMLDVRMAFSRLLSGTNSTGGRFTRVSSEPVVPRGMGTRDPATGLFTGAGSEWDSGMVFMATGVAVLPSEPSHFSMYYFGGQVTHGFEAYHVGEQYPAARGYGRLRWRRDGFVSLSTPFDGTVGTVLTKPLLIDGMDAAAALRLVLNLETSVSGEAVVHVIMGAAPDPMTATPILSSLPVLGNSVAATVIWKATLTNEAGFACSDENGPGAMPKAGDVKLQSDMAAAVQTGGNGGIRLRISVQDAHLFSITFEQ